MRRIGAQQPPAAICRAAPPSRDLRLVTSYLARPALHNRQQLEVGLGADVIWFNRTSDYRSHFMHDFYVNFEIVYLSDRSDVMVAADLSVRVRNSVK